MAFIILDKKDTAGRLERFLREKLDQSGLSGYVIGLSGGIDSSLSAAIAAHGVGADKVLGLLLPYKHSSEASLKDAVTFAEKFGLITEKIEISPMIDAYFGNANKTDPVRAGNKMARERMSILFDKAYEKNRMVLGTSNRTEICLGYGTWYGDVACSVNPLGMLYKTHVRQMAQYYEIPREIMDKPPTADLWPGQTDEAELELEYERVDQLLFMIIDEGIHDRGRLNDAGFPDKFIDRAVFLLNRSYFKRHLPEIADIGLKPIPDEIAIS
jgi:NAD+ synthase